MSIPTEERKLFRPNPKEKYKLRSGKETRLNSIVLKCRDKPAHATRAARDVTVLSTKWVRCAGDEK